MPRSRYDHKFCKLIVEYFEAAAKADTREVTPVVTLNETEKKGEGWKKSEVRRICAELPTVESFARSVGIPSTTIKTWAKDHEDFAEAYQQAKDIQYQLLVDRGLTRQYDASAFMFVAQNITGMHQRQVVAGDSDAPLTTRLVLVDAGAPIALPQASVKVIADD